jgi:hypothetical protein
LIVFETSGVAGWTRAERKCHAPAALCCRFI